MVKFAHIVHVPMTGVGIFKGFRGDKWFDDRLKIFKEYTLQSLINQSNRAFLLWLTFRPQEENDPRIKALGEYLHEKKMAVIMTFHGLPYWDDKFSPGVRNKIWNVGRVARQCWREKNPWLLAAVFEVIFNRKNKTLLHRLEKMLYDLGKLNELNDANYIYVTRIDSDDMFHKEAMAEIQRTQPFEGALTYQNGYIYNTNSRELAEWNPTTNPPFHTVIFLGSKFLNPVEHLGYYKDFRSHEDVPRVFKAHQLEEGRYCVLIHQKQISTIWNHPYRGKLVDASKLNDFI